MKTLQRYQWLKAGEEMFGSDLSDWRFICPNCSLAQSGFNFFRLGLQKDQVEQHLGFSCIGRFNNAETGCDYSTKQFTDNTITEANPIKHVRIILKNNKEIFVFKFAPYTFIVKDEISNWNGFD